MDLADGTPVTFASCQECEHRMWVGPDGVEMPIDEVLGRSRRQK